MSPVARRPGGSRSWAYSGPSKTRTLDSHASRLRRKLDPEDCRCIVNCWGIGYRLIEGDPSWHDGGMERVLGVGGYFIRSADPGALGAWYRDALGLDADENGLWSQGEGPTVFATFESGTDYFGSRDQQAMINFRVGDLDAMLAQLRAMGADVAEETQDMDGVGRFGWVADPEGNRIELWQPA